MSTTEETRKLAQKWFNALDTADYEAAFSCLADDVEWINLPKIAGVSDIIPWLGTCHGVQEVIQSFQIRDGVATGKVFKPLDLVVDGDVAVGTIHDLATVIATGLDYDVTFATWFHVKDGKIDYWKSFCDPS